MSIKFDQFSYLKTAHYMQNILFIYVYHDLEMEFFTTDCFFMYMLALLVTENLFSITGNTLVE